MPVDRPTVAKAEITSNSTTSSGSPETARTTKVPITTRATPSRATVRAWRSTEDVSSRPKASTCGSPLASATMAKNKIMKVVTLMPPAVLALPPPMNISTSVTSRLAGSISA